MNKTSSGTKPYVNGSMLQQHIGRTVCAIGKISEMPSSGMKLKVILADLKEVDVQLEDQLVEPLEGYVQLIARVNRDCSLICEHIVSFGSGELDLEIFNKTLMSMSNHADLFSVGEVNGMVH